MTTSTPTASPVEAEPSGLAQAVRDPGVWAEWAAVIGLVALLVIFGVSSPGFLSTGNIQGILAAAAIPIVLTIGQSFVIMTSGIDLSVASTMTFAAIVLGLTITGPVPFLALPAAVLAGVLIGLVNGTIIAKGKIADFIVTLGALSAASGLALILSDGKPITVIDGFMLKLSTQQFAGVLGWPILIAVGLALVAHVVLFHTKFGTHVLATGGNTEASAATGVRTDRIKIAVYALSGLLAGIGAILLVSRLGAATPAADTQFLLNSVAGVVLGGVNLFGGRGTIWGPVAGAILLTVLTAGLTALHVPEFYQPLAVGIVVVAAAFLSRFQK